MSARRRIIATATSLFASISAFAVLTPPAAQADSSDCPSYYICMWEDPNYRGSMYVRQPANTGSYDIDGWDGDNEISSVINNSPSVCVRMYDNDRWTGTTYALGKSEWASSLGSFDNEAESYKIYSC
jgi:hypothetical protein